VIILSGVLVIVAIVLLIVGIVSGNSGTEVLGLDGLNLIYVSIGVSIVSALFLLIGVILRRKELFGTSGAGSSGPAARTSRRGKREKTAKTESVSARPASAAAPEQPYPGRHSDADTEPVAPLPPPGDVPADAVVYVVPGRRRYHIDSCRQLAGRDKEELTFAEAREEGFSPCTACLPDTALAARAVSGGPATTEKPDTAAEEKADERPETGSGAEPAPDAAEHDTTVDAFGSNGSAAVRQSAIEDLAADEPEPVAEAGPATEPISTTDDKDGKDDDDSATDLAGDDADTPPANETAVDSEPEPDTPAEPEGPPPAPAGEKSDNPSADADGPEVRILSGTKRYHRPDCALIEDIGDEADDLESLTRAEAKARGCTPCLVCQPDKQPATRD
jgi:hypothetical protein